MRDEKVAMLSTQIVIAALNSTHINLGNAKEICEFYDAVSKQIYQTDEGLSSSSRASLTKMSE